MTIAQRYVESKNDYKDVYSFMQDVRFSSNGNDNNNFTKKQYEFLFKDNSVLIVPYILNNEEMGVRSSISINDLDGVRVGVGKECEGWAKWS